MQTLPRLFIVVATLALATGTASADSVSESLNEFRESLEFEVGFLEGSDEALERRQARGLKKAIRVLEKPSSSRSGDLRAAARVAAILSKGAFKNDDTWLFDLEEILIEFEDGLILDREAFEIVQERITNAGVLGVLNGHLKKSDKNAERALTEFDTRRWARFLMKAQRGMDGAVDFLRLNMGEGAAPATTMTGTYSLNIDDFDCVHRHSGTMTVTFEEIGSVRVSGTAVMEGWRLYDFFDCFVEETVQTFMDVRGIRYGNRLLLFFTHENAFDDYVAFTTVREAEIAGSFERDDFEVLGGSVRLDFPIDE